MIALLGAAGFGAIVGWYLYYINRYRKADVHIGDLATVVGILGGAVVMQLFGGDDKDLFGAYGIGLFVGFFGYFFTLLLLVLRSKDFDLDWFLDGRRADPAVPSGLPPHTDRPMFTGIKDRAEFAERLDIGGMSLSAASEIIDVCDQAWDANKSDCSAFVKAVAASFQIVLSGQADDIVQTITSDPSWTALADGPAAKAAADAGKLVIGGLKGVDMKPSQTHGHVVVVVSGPLANGQYPSAYWGKLGGVGRKNATTNYAWQAGDRDRVSYAARVV